MTPAAGLLDAGLINAGMSNIGGGVRIDDAGACALNHLNLHVVSIADLPGPPLLQTLQIRAQILSFHDT